MTESHNNKPHCSVGAGPLTSFVWKTGDAHSGCQFEFNLFRLQAGGGQVTQLLRPGDLLHLAKLIQVLSIVLAEDDCLTDDDRDNLNRLAEHLNEFRQNPSE